MSRTIDERVVEMKFDASQFNKNIDTSIQSINKLNTSINNMSTGKGLFNLSKAAEKVDFSKAEFAATHAGFHIQDVFEKATRYLEYNIAGRLVNWGTNIAKSLTIEPVFTGFNEYEQKMGSVQTIMNGANVSLEETSKTLEQLNEYADRTIYSFSDMTNNIGKFVNAGVKLDDAVMAIKGISNEAAVSGATAAEASRAMYNIAQSLSTGSMKLIDWKSIENANMATQEFKKTLIETGIELNAIRAGKGGNSKLTGEELLADPSKFRASIEGVQGQTWVTDKVMIEALKKYADETTEFGKKAYAAAQDVKTFTMLMDTLKEAAQSGWAVSMENIVGDFNEAKAMWTAVNNEIGGLLDKSADERNKLLEEWKNGKGRDALLNSISNIWFTLKDTISGVKEAFRDIFPPMTAERLIAITKGFESFTQKIRDFMASAETMGVIKTVFTGAFTAIRSVKEAIEQLWSSGKVVFGYFTEGFKEVFSATGAANSFSDILVKIGQKIKDISDSIYRFVTQSENAEKLKTIFQGIGAALELCVKGIKGVAGFAKDIFGSITESAKNSNVLTTILDIITSIAKAIIDLNNGTINFGQLVRKVFTGAIDLVKNLGNTIKTLIGNFVGDGKIGDALSSMVTKVKDFISGLTGKSSGSESNFGSNITEGLVQFKDKSKGIMDSISTNFSAFVEKIKSAPNSIQNSKWGPALSAIGKLLMGFLNLVTSIVNMVASLFNGMAKEFEKNPFAGLIKSFRTVEMVFLNSKVIGAIGRILGSVRSMKDVSTVGPLQSFMSALSALGEKAESDLPAILGNFRKFFDGFGNTIETFNQRMKKEGNAASAKGFATVIASLAALIVAVGALFYLIGQVDTNGVEQRMIIMSALMVELGALIGVVYGMTKKMSGTSVKNITKLFYMTTIVISIVAAVSTLMKSMSKLQDMDTGQIYAALISVSAIMWELVGITAVLNKIKAQSFSDVATSMLIMSFGIGQCAKALAAIGVLDWNQLAVGITGLAAVMTGMVLVSKFVNQIKIGDVSGMLVLAVAIGILGKAFTSLAQLSWNQFGVGISAVTAMLFEMVLATKMLKDSGMDMSVGVSMMLMAASIGILANALSKLSSLNADQLTQGWLAMAATMLYLLGFMKLMPDTCLQTAAALLIVSISLGVIASTIKKLGSMDFNSMLVALAGLALAIGAIWLTLKVLENNMAGAASLLIVSVGLIALASALKILGTMNLKSLGIAIIAMATSLGILAAVIWALSNPMMLLGAASILIVSGALIALALGLQILGSMSLAEIGTALLGLAGALVIFGVAAAVLTGTGIIVGMLLLAGVMVLMAGSAAIVGLGLTFIVNALTQLAIVGPDAAQAMVTICKSVSENYEEFLKASIAMIEFAKGLAAIGGALIVAGLGLITLSAAVGVLSIALIALSLAMIVVAAAILVVEAALAALRGQFHEMGDAVEGVADDFGKAGEEMLDSFVDGLTRGFQDAIDKIKQIGKSIWETFTGAFGGDDGVEQEAYEQGKAAGESYKKGLEDSTAKTEKKESGGFIDNIKDTFMGDSGLSIGGIDMKEMVGDTDVTSMIGNLNGGLTDTKALTGDSALNVESMASGTADTNALMEQMGISTDVVSDNTGTAANNMEQISKTDVSNVEALSDANLDGLTDPQQIKELEKTKDSVDAITESVDKTNEKEIKPKVDTSDLDKLVDDVMRGKYGNGMERMIALAEKYGEVQNKVNEKLGSSKRYEVGVDYSKGKASDIGAKISEPKSDISDEGLAIHNKLVELQKQYDNIIQSKAPESEKEAIRKRVSDQTRIWSEYMKKERGNLESVGMHDSREGMYASRDGENNGYNGAKAADDAGVREAQLKRLAEYQARGKDVAERNREMLDSFNNLGQGVNTATAKVANASKQVSGIPTQVQEAMKKNSKSISVPVTADTKEVEKIPQTVQQTVQSTQSQKVVVPVKADTKEVTGIPTQVQEAMKNAKQVDIPVKADSTQVKTATNDVNNLKKTTDQVKDKKVTLQADASGATKAVTEFSKNISKMSQSVDVETSKSKQSFQKFYTALQQTIQTYTPTVISNFKSTFEMAVTQTVNYLKSGTVLNQFKQIGVNAGRGMAEGLRTQLNSVKEAGKELANAASAASKKALKEKSPSKVFFDIGTFGGEGLAEGFISSMSTVSKAAEEMSMESVNSALTPLANLNLDEIDTAPTIKPILDMSDIESKSGIINSLLNRNSAAKISAEVDSSKNQQQVQDQQMANQMQLMNQKLTELSQAMKNPTPVNVDVHTTLEGDTKKFFEAMRVEDRRYQQTRGKSAFAPG